jgi:hypothetical protein
MLTQPNKDRVWSSLHKMRERLASSEMTAKQYWRAVEATRRMHMVTADHSWDAPAAVSTVIRQLDVYLEVVDTLNESNLQGEAQKALMDAVETIEQRRTAAIDNDLARASGAECRYPEEISLQQIIEEARELAERYGIALRQDTITD